MPKPALNHSTSRTLHRHQERAAGSRMLGSATRTPDPITRATRSPHSGHQQPHRRHTRRESLKLCDSFSTYDVRAVLMAAAWTPTTRHTALNLAVTLRATGPTPGFCPERVSQMS